MTQVFTYRFSLINQEGFRSWFCLPFSLNLSHKTPNKNIFTKLPVKGGNTRIIKLSKSPKINKEDQFAKLVEEKLKKKCNLNLNSSNDKLKLNKIRTSEIMSTQFKTTDKTYTVDRQLKVMNYNVLAQDLIELHLHLYKNHLPEDLLWKNRSPLLMNQIAAFLPDILALQEVQESHIGSFYSQLEKLGYRGIFKRRFGNLTDGCALYYNASLLELVEHHSIDFYRPHISNTTLNKPNVAIIARLRRSPKSVLRILGREIIVAITHLFYNPRRADVRLAQIQILLAEIHKVTKNLESEQPAVLLMGDLNSWPDSAVIKLLEEGRITPSIAHLTPSHGVSTDCTFINDNDASKCERNIENKPINGAACPNVDINPADKYMNEKQSEFNITHNFDFKSVYDWRNPNGQPFASTYHNQWVVVDYMFYTKNMKLVSRLKLPTVDQCTHEIGWIPNKESPSDHFPLAATFFVE